MRKFSINLELVAVISLLLIYTIAASAVSLHRYWQFDAFWYDFGILDETIWKLSRFELPVIPTLNPPLGKIVWADHFNPSISLLVPIYWLTSRAEAILVAQTLVVVVSAGVGYFLARLHISSLLVRIALVVSFLGYVGLQNALYTDIHNIVFATLPLMMLIFALYEKKWRLYWTSLLLLLGVQENMALVGVGLGLFLLLRKERHIKKAVTTIGISLLYGVIIYALVIPFFNHGPYNYRPDYPTVWYEWVTRFFSQDLKTPTIIYTFLTFGGLPLLVPALYPLVFFHFLERFVLNTAATRWDLGFHYNVLLSPIIFLGCIEVLRKLKNSALMKTWAILTIFVVFFLHRFVLHGPLLLATHPVFYEQTERNKFIAEFVNKVPSTGLLMTQNNMATHFTHRPVTILHKNFEKINPDIVAVDIRPGQNANNFFPLKYEDVKSLVASLSANPSYSKVNFTDSQVLFVRANQ